MDKSGISHIARVLRGEGFSGEPSLARGFRLGGWSVRPDLCTLDCNGRHVQLEPKTMGVLLCLAQHATQVVTREQFMAEVWHGRVVTDEVLSRAISQLRSQLGDDPHEPRFIRTIPRVGYSLIATVERPRPRAAEAGMPMRRARAWLAATAALAVLAAVAGWWVMRDRGGPPTAPVRLAVLPLESIGGAGDSNLADGLTDELTVSLARVPGLRVVARNSALRYRSGDADLAEVARALRATHVLSGSVRASESRLRVSLHLADSQSGSEVWAETYDRNFGDLFGVQAEISAAVAQALRGKLPRLAGTDAKSAATFAEAPPANPEAYRLYLQGRQQLARRGEEGLRAAIDLLERSVKSDPGFLRAHYALAWACTLLVNVAPAEATQAIARADRELAAVARETAMSGEALAVRAWLELERNHWIEADTAFRAALAATPDDTELRLLYSQMLGALGKLDGANREAYQALVNDPQSPAAFLRLAVLRLWADDEVDAARDLAKARGLGLAPSAAPEVTMLLYVRKDEMMALEQGLRDLQRRRGQSDEWVPLAVAAIPDAGKGAAAEAAMDRAADGGQIDGLMHFGALVLTGRNERALEWLLGRSQLRTRELEFALLSREGAGLRRLPGFPGVVTRFGLDRYWDQFGWPANCDRNRGAIRCR